MTRPPSNSYHGTTVAIDGIGIFITGPSGAGKSDLALRLIDRGAKLVSDDQTLLSPRDGQLIAAAPVTICGKLEIRGVGIVECPSAPETPVQLMVQLVDHYERFPHDHQMESLAGIDVMRVKLNANEASAPIKVEWALRVALARANPVAIGERLT